VGLLDAAYRGGYAPTFDRDGPLQPTDIWWSQSEKDTTIIEVDRRPAGALVIGRGRQWLVEELLIAGFGEAPARRQASLVERVAAHLTAVFQRSRQPALLLRVAEINAFGLALAAEIGAVFANALLVYRHAGPKRAAPHPPDGYHLRRSTPADAGDATRLVREIVPERARADQIARVLTARDGRGFLAFKDAILAGFAAAEVRPGRGDWMVGVREAHRRRGVGRALGAAALGALRTRGPAPYATAWALDPVAGPFLASLGFAVERTFLYLEKPL
jgi:GNAT superfamily N-acetyltransferase